MLTVETKKAIRRELIKNPEINRAKLAVKYGVGLRNVGAAFASLNRAMNKAGKQKKGNNTYSNHNGVNKERARKKMVNHVIYSGVTGNILTLPNTEWVIEKNITKGLKGVCFTAVECVRETFLEMRRNAKKFGLNFTANFGFVHEFIYGKVENTYAHLVLDYCGELPKISKEIEYAINNNIVAVGGIIAVTFVKQIRGSKNTLLGEKITSLAAINNSDTRCETERSAEAYFHKITGWNYEIQEFFYYQDKGHTPMALVIIKRIK